MARGKANEIPKELVWEAYQKVKANRGAAGVDGQSLAARNAEVEVARLQHAVDEAHRGAVRADTGLFAAPLFDSECHDVLLSCRAFA